jgi:hypothetical protein
MVAFHEGVAPARPCRDLGKHEVWETSKATFGCQRACELEALKGWDNQRIQRRCNPELAQ